MRMLFDVAEYAGKAQPQVLHASFMLAELLCHQIMDQQSQVACVLVKVNCM